jgi:hypothetical protein
MAIGEGSNSLHFSFLQAFAVAGISPLFEAEAFLMDDATARRFLKLIRFLARRPLTREEKKEQGLKYCRWPPYGYRWYRGKRVVDREEQDLINQILEWKLAGCTYAAIARHLLYCRVLTRDRREWSADREASVPGRNHPTAEESAGRCIEGAAVLIFIA